MSDAKPWLRPNYTRQYEFPEEPDPVVRVELDHLLRRLSRASGAEREAIDLEIDKLVARERARQAETTAAPQLAGDDPDGRVVSPWDQIAEAYRRLASESPGINQYSGRVFRRERPMLPSRPEVAADIGVSPSTITRRCEAAGRGTRWPPRGL